MKPKVKLVLKSIFIMLTFLLGVSVGRYTKPTEVFAKELDVISHAASSAKSIGTISKGTNLFTETVSNTVEEVKEEIKKEEFIPVTDQTENLYSIDELEFHGVINWNGYKFTYYSERVLSGSALSIPGRYTDDYVRDENGYIVLASSYEVEMGTIIDTPFGSKGKVYDRCPECTPNWFDVYTR